jgi:hypothetical protein
MPLLLQINTNERAQLTQTGYRRDTNWRSPIDSVKTWFVWGHARLALTLESVIEISVNDSHGIIVTSAAGDSQ